MTSTADATVPLRKALAAVRAPSDNEAADFKIAVSLGAAFLARARSDAPTLLIPLSSAPDVAGRRGGGFSLSPVGRVVFEYEDRHWEQAAATLECTESHLVDTFLILVLDIVRRLGTASAPIDWQTVVAWVDEWQTLLARRPALTAEQQLGLWGELWVISNALRVDGLLAAWRGPESEATDFFLDGVALEVKTSRQAHVHHASQRQIESPAGRYPAYLLSVWLGIDPVRGVSLAELVDSVLARTAEAAAVLKKMASLGYVPIDRDQYSTRFVPLDRPRWFRAEDVPRVRVVDSGVSQIRYVVSLDVDRALTDEQARVLWEHFCDAEPRLT
jgi:hypothetical protein